MQPSSGERSSSAHTPQNANSSATEMINLLSFERFCGMRSFMKSPNMLPSSRTRRFSSTGFPSVSNEHPLTPLKEASAMEIAIE